MKSISFLLDIEYGQDTISDVFCSSFSVKIQVFWGTDRIIQFADL